MIFEDLKEFTSEIGRTRRLMGIDLGTKTIGLALSDGLGMVASPLETLPKGKFSKDVVKLKDIISAEEICGIVMGLPREMDGTQGKRCQATRTFAHNLKGQIDLPILLWDERLSTVAVERVLIDEADLSRNKRKSIVDKAAAAFILQGVLEAMNLQVGSI